MCSLEGGYASQGSEKEALQRRVDLGAQLQWTGLTHSTDTFPRKVIGLRPDQPSRPAQLEFMIKTSCSRHPVRLLSVRFIIEPLFCPHGYTQVCGNSSIGYVYFTYLYFSAGILYY